MEKKKQKKNYSAPACEIVHVNETTNLMDASMPGRTKRQTTLLVLLLLRQVNGMRKTLKTIPQHHGKTNRELLTKKNKSKTNK